MYNIHNMEIIKSSIKHDLKRDNYWTKVTLKSFDDKQTLLFACASYEYLFETFKKREFGEKTKNKWVDNVVSELKSKGAAIFKAPVHFDVKAITDDGVKNGENFLKNEIVPISL